MSAVDVCGLICLCLLYGCVAYGEYALIVWVIVPVMADSLWAYVHVAIFNLCLVLALWAHGRATFGDPGVVPLPKTHIDFSTVLQLQNNGVFGLFCCFLLKYQTLAQFEGSCENSLHSQILLYELNSDWTICARCETYRPPHAHHCRICNRCVRRMDHHCPWINNCVGELNQKYFLQFLVYTGATCLYGTVVVVISWQLEEAEEAGVPLSEYRQNRLIHTVIFLVKCLLFGLFVSVIFCDQLSSVMHGPQQDTKGHGSSGQRRNKSCRSSMRDVCGRGALWKWAIPCTAPPHSSRSSYEV